MLSISKIVELALTEDIFTGDISSTSIIPADRQGVAIIHMKEAGIISGLEVVREVFHQVDEKVLVEINLKDGDRVEKGQTVARISGSMVSILTGERLALNFLQRMSGIATKTRYFVDLVEGHDVRIVDTRKTTPLLRLVEKQAVRDGGGHNHRFGLYDAVMIKDNHIKAAGGIKMAVKLARAQIPHTMTIEVETENLDQVQEALDAGADIIMLDNMAPDLMHRAVDLIAGRAIVEASGGVNEANIMAIAATGIDIISLGALTHTIESLDISLDLNEIKNRV